MEEYGEEYDTMSNAALNRRLRLYLEAEHAILHGGQSYTIEDMVVTRADLGKIQDMIAELRAAGATEADETDGYGPKRARRILFRD